MDTNNTATTATGRLPVTVVDVATGRITADSCLCGGPPILRLGRVWVGVVRLTLCGEPWPIPDGASFRLRMTDTDKARHYESRPVRGDGPGDIVATVDLGADPYPYKAGQGWLEIDMDNRVVMSDKVVLRGPLATPSSSLDGVPVVVVADGVLALSGVPTVYQMPPIPAGQAEAGLRVIPAGVPRAYRLSFHSDAPSLLLSVDGAAVTGEYAGPGWYCADVTEDGDGNVTVSYARMAATDPTAAWLPCRYGVEVVTGDWPLHGRPGTLYVHAVTHYTRVWRDGEWYDLSGQPGATPYAGPNGNWFINGSDTGVRARAEDAYIDRVRLTMGMLSPDTQDDDADPATMWRGTVPGYAVAASFHETPASPLPTVYHTRMSYDPAMALSSVWLTQGEVDHIAAMPPGKDVLILDVLDKVTPLMVIPHIDPVTGNWVIGSEDTGRRATGSSLAIIDGEWAIDGVATGELAFLEWLGDLAGPPADGRRGQAYRDGALGEVMVHDGDSWAMMARDGYTPYIEDGEWHIAGEPIGVPATGPANTLSIGTVAKGDDAQATITGTAPSQTLNLTLPKGDTGPANTLSIGTVAKGDDAQATITGAAPNQTLNLTLPKGDPNTLSIGLVTKGLTPQATITGTAPNQVLGLVLPQGDTGPATTLSIGTVTKGDEAQATITGTPPDQTLSLVLPKGDPNTLSIGTVTKGNEAQATITGTAPSQTLSLVLPKGDVGATGPANTLAIGTVTKGDEAQATITGTAPSQTLNLTLPKGDPGPANTLSIGTVAKGDEAQATITGNAPSQTLNLTLPKGDPGIPVVWLGSFATPPAAPALNNAYRNTADNMAYVFDGTAWQVMSVDPVLAFQHSADGVAWSDTYTSGDTYIRYSVDRGATWSGAMVFKGRDATQDYQYSADGVAWRADYAPYDYWQRLSVDGGLTWSPAMRIRGDNAPLPQYQYSFDTTDWHAGWQENDYWTRISVDGGLTWGGPARIRGEGMRVAQCSDKGIIYGEETITLNWTDPPDVELNGAILARWQKTVLVRKKDSYPTAYDDGDIVASTVRALGTKSHYRDNPFVDTDIEAGEEYFYKLFSQTESGNWNDLDGNKYAPATGWSWTMLRAFIRAKNWDQLPPIGTVFGVPHEEFGTIHVRFSGKNTHTPTDRQYTEMMLLECVDILFTAQFDAPEATYGLTLDTTAGTKAYYVLVGGSYVPLEAGVDYQVGGTQAVKDGVTYPIGQWYEMNVSGRGGGSNRYSQSNIDQGLNADYALDAYTFVKRNPWDALSTTWMRDGLLRYIDPDFKACLLPVDIATGLANIDGGGNETISRRVFLPSTTELYSGGTQGRQWDWYVDTVSADKVKLLNGVATSWWTRSPIVSNPANIVFSVNASGASGATYAYDAYGVSPAFALG